MLNKGEFITKLTEAKTKHERWMAYAKAMYNGIPIGDEHTPLMHTDCEFGKWMKANGELLYYAEVPKTLDEDHKVLHKVYMDIYKLINNNKSSNIFNKSKIEKAKNDALKKNFKILESISAELVKTIDQILNRINSMTEKEIASLG